MAIIFKILNTMIKPLSYIDTKLYLEFKYRIFQHEYRNFKKNTKKSR